MRTHKIKVTIPADHQLAVRVPDDFPTGPAEVIIQADSSAEQRIVKLAGVLAPQVPPPPHGDPIADALQEFRYGVEIVNVRKTTGSRLSSLQKVH